eukprot:TRINITY_DN37483_c0_g1_i1.p1 TRINITY_DN37483_c0_g1~~TRINITY_DN37483_c0_g1_i1.p1  ORF type:complete len:178 (-),score=42.11 TRINITY_DN37483_c0_g1_i1:190-723(-)
MSRFTAAVVVLLVAALASPSLQRRMVNSGTTDQITEHTQTIGNLLRNLPSIFSKTASWIRGLGDIGDEIHPEVGNAIRQGADAVEEASQHVPENLHTQVDEHVNKVVNVTKILQSHVNQTLQKLPEVREKVAGLPGDDIIMDVLDTFSTSDADLLMQEAIDHIEPVADAISGSQNSG